MRRNWLHETKKETHERRIKALEDHIQDTEARFADLQNYVNAQLAQCPDVAAHIAAEWPVSDG